MMATKASGQSRRAFMKSGVNGVAAIAAAGLVVSHAAAKNDSSELGAVTEAKKQGAKWVGAGYMMARPVMPQD